MKYNPEKQHRRSIRLKGYNYTSPGTYFITICTHQRECLFGKIVEGEMRLNELGNVVRSRWINLPHHHKHIALDAFVVMPNHIHTILILTDNPSQNSTNRGGAAFGAGLSYTTQDKLPNATSNPVSLISPIGSGQSIVESEPGESEPGVAFDSNHLGDWRRDTIINPVMIAEVLSESTEAYDRSGKFAAYRTIPSFQEYLLIDQYSIHVEQYYKTEPRKWVFSEYDGEETILTLNSVAFEISLADLYDKVTFETE